MVIVSTHHSLVTVASAWVASESNLKAWQLELGLNLTKITHSSKFENFDTVINRDKFTQFPPSSSSDRGQAISHYGTTQASSSSKPEAYSDSGEKRWLGCNFESRSPWPWRSFPTPSRTPSRNSHCSTNSKLRPSQSLTVPAWVTATQAWLGSLSGAALAQINIKVRVSNNSYELKIVFKFITFISDLRLHFIITWMQTHIT